MEYLKDNPYMYIIDTCSILSQKDDEPYRRKVFKSQWEKIDAMVQNKQIVTCSEIAAEVEDQSIQNWMHALDMEIIPIDDDIQNNVCTIVTTNIQIVDFKSKKSSGDVFLIATAMKYHLIVITEERKKSPKKIPYCCAQHNIECINIIELCEREGWVF